MQKKILIITQKVYKSDQVLGFFHEWISAFARKADTISVVCLEKGDYNLPHNVAVYSLGKERGIGKLGRVLRFYGYIWRLRKEYDVVFVHMNPVYIVLGGLLWRLMNKRIYLWYTHKNVDLKLKFATFLSHGVFTASSESFKYSTNKLIVTGHGIDIYRFKMGDYKLPIQELVTVGRISRSKQVDVLIKSIAIVKKTNPTVRFLCIGSPITSEDRNYMKELQAYVEHNNLGESVTFAGTLQQHEVSNLLARSHVFISGSKTGGLDKAILEALASGILVISSNIATKSILASIGECLVYNSGNCEELAQKIQHLFTLSNNEIQHIRNAGRREVEQNHELHQLISTIIKHQFNETGR